MNCDLKRFSLNPLSSPSPLITMENGSSSPIKKSNGVVEGGSFDQVRKWWVIIRFSQMVPFRFWTWGILGTQTRRRDHKACPGEVNISGGKNNMLCSIIQIIIWKIWSVKHISFPARCGHLKRPRSRVAGEHLKLQVANKLIGKDKEYETQLSQVQDHTDNFLYFRPPLVMTPQRRRKCKISENPVV